MNRAGLFYVAASLITAIFLMLPTTLFAAKQCGDANNDDQVNIFDVTFLISYLYLEGPSPLYPHLSDVDNSGVINIFDITCLISYLYLGGAEPNCAPGPDQPLANLTSFYGCKTFNTGTRDDSIPSEMDCIRYQYDGDGILSLEHVNAGFNCCPADIIADITIQDNFITITEAETYDDTLGGCWCLCLFDVDYEIINLPPGEYTIRVIGLYLMEGDDSLVFTLDLGSTPEGIYCVERDHYPWGFDYGSAGRMTGNQGCKLFPGGKSDPSPNDDCVEYEYDGQDILLLNHFNAGFNCCPVICANITMDDSLILITESETYDTLGPCYCLCLFDVYYELTDVEPKEYVIRFIEPYFVEGDEPLEFIVDLSSSPAGNYCVYRDHYPWGIESGVSGSLTGYDGCKTFMLDKDSLDEDCLVYDYDGSGTLQLTHLNDIFNCCPDTLMADINIEGHVITIIETEDLSQGGGCDCTCLFDLYYEITNLPPDEYIIRVDNTYYYDWLCNGEVIEFTVDLTTATSGYFCVDRQYLPWDY